MADDMKAYRDVFASESAEFVQSMVNSLLQLEDNPGDLEPVEAVFRSAHSLKGMAAAMGYERTEDLTHKMESLMDTVRRREQPPDPLLVDLMLRAADTVKGLIGDEMRGEVTVDPSGIIEELATRAAVPAPARSAEAAEVEVVSPRTPADGSDYLVRVALEDSCVLKSVRAYMVIKRLAYMGTVIETHPSARDIEDENFELTFEVVLRTTESSTDVQQAAAAVTEVEEVEVATCIPAPQEKPGPGGEEGAPKRAQSFPKLSETQTVRIAIGHLDTLVNLVGELVIVRSRLENLAAAYGQAGLRESLEDLGRISAELQHEVMQTRMVPVGNIFNRFPRMIRDLARDLKKEVAFEMEGFDIELDRTVLDEIGDPLVHLLRNAVDHGIEPAGERIASGKSPKGTIRLAARRERDQVQLIVSDDGRGMDVDRIWAEAVERGLVEAGERDAFSAEDIMQLTCRPGFSTSETATKVSGRGVGMDVVRGKIEHLGGSLTIRSGIGSGSEFMLSLPLTLAITQALLLSAGDQVFALPLSFVNEVFGRDEVDIDTFDGAPVLTLRDGRVVPLCSLEALIGATEDKAGMPAAGDRIVLMDIGEQTRALTVTSLIGRQEVVIKPLAPMLKQIKGLGGATVLGDGSVALILDPRSLFSMGEVA